jgi:predicted TIM-barrel fold metal-dependent hydrolase
MMQPPPGAVDTHVHVFDPARFPFAAQSAYHPSAGEVGTADDLAAVLDAAGIERVVLVNPTSGYGTDNRCMLDALERLGARARGIARVPLDCSGRALDDLARKGIVGVRIDFIGAGGAALDDGELPRLIARLADRDMVCALQAEAAQWLVIADLVERSAGRFVIDHCGRPDAGSPVDAPGFAAVLRLAETRRVALKLSGPMRFSRQGPPYADTDPFYAAAVRAFSPRALMWGSDWPFLRSDRRLDYGPSLAHLQRVLPGVEDRLAALVTTPGRWFFAGR